MQKRFRFVVTTPRVDFASCGNLTDVAAEHLVEFPPLQSVNFEGCRSFPNESAEHPEQEEQQQDEQSEPEEQQRDESKFKERNRGNGACGARRYNRRAKQHEARLTLAKEIVQKVKTITNTPSANMPAKSMKEFLCRAFWHASVEMAG